MTYNDDPDVTPRSERMEKWLAADPRLGRWFITFASPGLKNGWIEVAAKDEKIVMAWANETYGRWSSHYHESSFDLETSTFFPKGRLGEELVSYEDVRHVRFWVPPWADLKKDAQMRRELGIA